MQKKTIEIFAVDHRKEKPEKPDSLVTFIYPDDFASALAEKHALGRFGADFGELRALEESLRTQSYSGVLHYRRVLILDESKLELAAIKSTWEGSFISAWNWSETFELGWSHQNLTKLSKENAIILPNKIDVGIFDCKNLLEQFQSSHGEDVIQALKKRWDESEPFFEYLENQKTFVPYNIFLAPYEIRKKLFDWLLPILKSIESDLIHLSPDPYQKRWPGFIAERLVSYFWDTVVEPTQISYRPIARLDNAIEFDFCPDKLKGRIYVSACDKNYLIPTSIALESYATNAVDESTYVVLTSASEIDYSIFQSSLQSKFPNQNFEFIHIDVEGKVLPWNGINQWSLPTFFRLLIPIFVNSKSALWVDSDTLSLGDVSDVFDLGIQESFAISAAPDIFMDYCRQIPASTPRLEGNSWENYYHDLLPISEFPTIFQCGMLVINTEEWRKQNDHWHLLKKAAAQSFPGGADQDLLNLHFKGRIKELPQDYNYVNHGAGVVNLIEKFSLVDNRSRVKAWKDISKPKVVHFTGAYLLKPFDTISQLPLSLEYWSFAKQSIFSPLLDERIQNITSQKEQGTYRHVKESNARSLLKKTLFPILFSIYIKSPNWLRKNKFIRKPKAFLRRRLL